LTIIVAGFLTLALLITGLRLFTKPDATSKSGNKSTLYSTERKLYQSIKGMKSALRFTTKL